MSQGDTRVHSREDGRDTRWADHRAERREIILGTAIVEIERKGGEVGVSTIADEAGIPRSVVYRLFKNREDLDEQIRTRIVEDLLSALLPALKPELTIRQSIDGVAREYVGWVNQHPRLHHFLGTGSASRPTTNSKIVVGTRNAMGIYFSRLLDVQLERIMGAGNVPEGNTESLAFGLVGLVDGAVNRWVTRPNNARTSADELSDLLADALWGALSSSAIRFGVQLDPHLELGPIDLDLLG